MDANTRVESGAFLAISGLILAGAFNLLNISVALIAATGLLIPLIAIQLMDTLCRISFGGHKRDHSIETGSDIDSFGSDGSSHMRSSKQKNADEAFAAAIEPVKQFLDDFKNTEDGQRSTGYTKITGHECPEVEELILSGLKSHVEENIALNSQFSN